MIWQTLRNVLGAAWLLAALSHQECGGATVLWRTKTTPPLWREKR